MTGRVKVGAAIAAPALTLLALGILLWVNRPFQAELGSYRTSLADRTEAQRHNIRQAVLALDGVVLEPGETFSFNAVVGPRTPERGYREAPAFLERDLVKSIGGGICQLSSTVYNAVALAGLTIVERHPHSKIVKSVPPGRDATVWYGMTDLRFKNSYSHSVRLRSEVQDASLRVSFWGHRENQATIQVKTTLVPSTHPNKLAYETWRQRVHPRQSSRGEIISLDMYTSYP